MGKNSQYIIPHHYIEENNQNLQRGFLFNGKILKGEGSRPT
jgi:hypothetical protein